MVPVAGNKGPFKFQKNELKNIFEYKAVIGRNNKIIPSPCRKETSETSSVLELKNIVEPALACRSKLHLESF